MPFILTTPVGELEMPSVNMDEVAPGSSYADTYGQPLEVVVKNSDNAARTSHAITAVQFGSQEAHEYLRFSLDGTTFAPGPLSLGEFAAGQGISVFIDAVLPVDAVTGTNKRAIIRLIPDG